MPKRKCCCSNSDQCSDIQNRLKALGASHMYEHFEFVFAFNHRVISEEISTLLKLNHFLLFS